MRWGLTLRARLHRGRSGSGCPPRGGTKHLSRGRPSSRCQSDDCCCPLPSKHFCLLSSRERGTAAPQKLLRAPRRPVKERAHAWRVRVSSWLGAFFSSPLSGGTLARRLAPSGKRILLLERGGYVPREKDNWNPRAVNLEAKYNTREVWHDKDGHELHPHTNYYVGGNTKFYGAALFRLRKEDFGEIQHHGGVSPAWPIRYDDLESRSS